MMVVFLSFSIFNTFIIINLSTNNFSLERKMEWLNQLSIVTLLVLFKWFHLKNLVTSRDVKKVYINVEIS